MNEPAPLESLSDEQLLAAIGRLWDRMDPPPADLADGALARLVAQDLEFDLLTLVESEGSLAGVRSVQTLKDRDEVGTWSLEYVGNGFRVYVRISKSDDVARVDGWVVPARSMSVRLSTESLTPVITQTKVNEHGRFDFPGAPTGACRLTFINEPRTEERPQVTPPFWI